MFVGREDELAGLERLYQSDGFQMVVVYGRRRVGKMTLIDEFAKGKDTLYFTAQLRSPAQNLQGLSAEVREHFGMPATLPAFASWSDAFQTIAELSQGRRLVFVFDELPYAARTEPGLPSALQVAIDHHFKRGNAFIILCGGNEGFMESEVLGRKSPLYGRRTAQIHLAAFDYLDAARMLPDAPPEELISYYAAFGGTPHYLAQVNAGLAFEQNVAALMFDKMGLLYEEPLMLLRQELREPALYNSILSAIASGKTEPARIANATGVEPNSVGKYLKTLVGLHLVERRVPFGENPAKSKRGLYRIADPFFAFWYRFVEPAVGAIELGAGQAVAAQVCAGQELPAFIGTQFEKVAMQYAARRNRAGGLPFLATSFGSWWGTDPALRERVDIDLIAASKREGAALFGECKWRNSFNEAEAVDVLERRSALVGGFDRRFHALFTKRPVSDAIGEKASHRGDLLLVSAEDMFEDMRAGR